MSARPWLASYPAGMPHEVRLEQGLTLPALLERSFARWPERIAFRCGEAARSYRAVDRLSADFAGYLQGAGLRAGDRVALMLPNGLAYAVALAGALRAGAVVVSVNPLYTARELTHQLRDSGARVLVSSTAALPTLAQIRPELPLAQAILVGDWLPPEEDAFAAAPPPPTESSSRPPSPADTLPFEAARAAGRARGFIRPVIEPADTAFLQYTGGTAGVAKGAALSHANMLANIGQMLAWLDSVFRPGDCACVTPLPLYHIYPLNIALLLLLSRGGTNRLVANPRDMPSLLAELARAPFDLLIGVNTLFNGLLASGGLRRADFEATGTVIGAGAAIQQAVAERWKAATGVPIREGYGLTECCPCVAFNVLGGADWTGSIGLPMPSTEVKLIDAEGRTLPVGASGELCVRGPQVFGGYWQRPEDTAKAFTDDGWLRTGDVVRMDAQGFLHIVDRLKDMILVSGFNVYPNEIEAVVAMLPDVLEAACIGVPDARSGEVPQLFVVARDPALSAERIDAHCRDHLAAYKRPRHIRFVDALPKSAVGKILRKELRDLGPA